jgi:hypothetical protein
MNEQLEPEPLIVFGQHLPKYIRNCDSICLLQEAERQKNSISGLNEYILNHDTSGSHTPMASSTGLERFYMNESDIYKLFEHIHLRDNRPLYVNMLQEYDKTGYLVMKSDYDRIYVYAEDFTRFENFLKTCK